MRDTAVALGAAGIDNARFEARLLLGRAAALSTEQLIACGPEPAPPAVASSLRSLTARRVRREPMAYILGEREFWGLTFKVTPAVLVPRPDSETLIEAVLELLPERGRQLRILDLGIGTGCLLLTLLREYPQSTGVGMDTSREALAVARGNAADLGVAGRTNLIEGDWRQPDWTAPLPGPFNVVVSNPPYIAAAAIDQLMPEVAQFEPRLSLDGGPDGLAAYRAIAGVASKLITRRGWLVVEAGEGQSAEMARIFATSGLAPKPPWRDLGGIERVVAAAY